MRVLDHTVLVYYRVGRVIVLYVVAIVSLLFLKTIAVTAFNTFVVFVALSVLLFMRLLNISLVSNVSPSILGCLHVGKVVSSIVSDRVLLHSVNVEFYVLVVFSSFTKLLCNKSLFLLFSNSLH